VAILQQRAAACLHSSKEPFDQLYACIRERRDVGAVAKLVYGRLTSQRNLARKGKPSPWTQEQIGESIGASRHQVWRALEELKAAGLVQIIRYGLGQPNGYVLLGLPDEGRASGRPDGRRPVAGRAGTAGGFSFKEPRTEPKNREAGPRRDPREYLLGRYGLLPRR
jgi:biotin operon repressor